MKEQLKKWRNEQDIVYIAISKKENEYFDNIHKNNIKVNDGWKELNSILAKDRKRYNELDRKIRLNMEYKFYRDLDADDDIYPIDKFKAYCEAGGFIDSDGYGNYTKDGKVTNIEIYPSDFKYNNIRKDFDIIVWYNK